MRVIHDITNSTITGPVALTIGVCDGVHRGHQRLICETAAIAAAHSSLPVLLTFWPHPAAVLRPDTEILYLNTLDERLERLAALDLLAATIVMPFTAQTASTSAAAFLDRLRHTLDIRALVMGANFAFGRGREGTLHFLRVYGQQQGIDVISVPLVQDQHSPISSTRIRVLLGAGDIASANRLLGYAYSLRGTVVKGDQRGREIGFPTANLALDPAKLVPANGVYAARAWESTEQRVYDAAMNIGVRPTFDGLRRTIEVHLLDTEQESSALDLYGHTLIVELIARLRPERRFPSIDALRDQLRVDVEAARSLLARKEQTHETTLEV